VEVKIEKPKSYIREMHIAVAYEQYAKEKARVTESYRYHAEVPGFRKGRAPASMVAGSYKSQIEKEAKENFIRGVFAKAVQEHHIIPITYAHVMNFNAKEQEGVVEFSVKFQVIPDFELSLAGLSTSYTPPVVPDEQVLKVIKDLQQKYTTVRPVARAAKAGDTVEFDYVAYDASGIEVDSAQGMTVTCSKKEKRKTVASALCGLKAGDEREISVAYPSTFPVIELEGKDVRIKLTIREVKEAAVPAINDEFAKTVGMDSEHELKQSIKKQLENEEEMKAHAEARNTMIEKLLKINEFEVPSSLIDFYAAQHEREGIRKEMKEQNEKAAAETAKLNIILDRIAEEQKITIDEEEIKGLVEREAARESVDAGKLRSYLERSGKMEDIIVMLKRNRAFANLEKQYVNKA
jgi:trigger factor